MDEQRAATGARGRSRRWAPLIGGVVVLAALAVTGPVTIGGAAEPVAPATAAEPEAGLNASGEFTALPVPTRIVDSRLGLGTALAPFTGGVARTIQVAGAGRVPAVGVLAAVMNVTVTNPTAFGYLTVFPSGQPRPVASNLNVAPSQTVANLVTVGVGPTGSVEVFLNAGTGDVIIDVVGWYATSTVTVPGSRLVPLAPSRILDTRNATGVPGTTPVGQSESIAVQVAGRGGVPASGVSAVVVNLTATQPTMPGYILAYPGDAPARPAASNLNVAAGQTRANLATVRLGADGTIRLFNKNGTVHLIADVVGYYAAPGTVAGLRAGRVVPLSAPFRVLDTRHDGLALGPGQEDTWDLTPFVAGLRTPEATPIGPVAGVIVNVTVVGATRPSHFIVYPTTLPALPTSSNLNVVAGDTVPNLALLPLPASGTLAFYLYDGTAHYLADVGAVILAD